MYYKGENVTLVGDVRPGHDVSIWHGSVLRADLNRIVIGDRTNIQDLTLIHVDEKAPVIVGNDCVVGHRCILHGCIIEDNVLIGMGAILMDHCVIGEGSIIGAGALVLEGTKIPPGSLVVGSPAKVIKEVTPKQVEEIKKAAAMYVEEAKKGLRPVE